MLIMFLKKELCFFVLSRLHPQHVFIGIRPSSDFKLFPPLSLAPRRDMTSLALHSRNMAAHLLLHCQYVRTSCCQYSVVPAASAATRRRRCHHRRRGGLTSLDSSTTKRMSDYLKSAFGYLNGSPASSGNVTGAHGGDYVGQVIEISGVKLRVNRLIAEGQYILLNQSFVWR